MYSYRFAHLYVSHSVYSLSIRQYAKCFNKNTLWLEMYISQIGKGMCIVDIRTECPIIISLSIFVGKGGNTVHFRDMVENTCIDKIQFKRIYFTEIIN